MVIDRELQRHTEMWHAFTRLMKWAVGGIVVLLLLLAFFLL